MTKDTEVNHPTPEELQARFHIPREYIRHLAAWMNISESMMYQMYRDRRNPGTRLKIQLERRCGIDPGFWDADLTLDQRNKMLYSHWYKTIGGTNAKT